MSDFEWPVVRALFDAVVELPDSERAAHIECAGVGPEARAEVERMLRSDGVARRFLESPAALLEQALLPRAGTRVGHYELKRVIASGGMGTVFEAVQDEPRRTVALKTLRFGGIASPQRVQRFRFEAEVLGQLRHPSIAQIFEAGTHEEGGEIVPFIAMELVPGARDLLSYAREEELELPQRLALFLEVCEAVQHGHQKGVIHRDLKPGNILVDAEGRAKVIDFGVARATSRASGLDDVTTQTGQILGTFAYMAPEQLAGSPDAVDVRSDVYALGILLFELIEGRPPHELADKSLAEALRTLQEEPARPSASTPRELGWILDKALAKEPERRYGSAAELAEDLRRYLRREPVLAGPPGVAYQLARFVRRQRTFLTATVAVIAALALGLVRAEHSARAEARARADADRLAGSEARARREADELARAEAVSRTDAEHEARKARDVNEFIRSILTAASPVEFGREALVVDALDEAARRIDSSSSADPEVQAAIRRTIGDSYAAIGRLEKAQIHLTAAKALVEEHLPPDDPFAIGVQGSWIEYLARSNRHESILSEAPRVLALAENALGAEHGESSRIRRCLGMTLCRTGRANEGEPLLRENLDAIRRRSGARDEQYVVALLDLSNALLDRLDVRYTEHYEGLPEVQELEEYLTEALELARELYPDDHYLIYTVRTPLLQFWSKLGRLEESEALCREQIAWSRTKLGNEHPEVWTNVHSLSIVLGQEERFDEAIALGEEALLGIDQHFGARSAPAVMARYTLSVFLLDSGNAPDAESIAREGLEVAEAVLPDHIVRLQLGYTLGEALMKQGRWADAIEILRALEEQSQRVLGPQHSLTLGFQQYLAESEAELGR